MNLSAHRYQAASCTTDVLRVWMYHLLYDHAKGKINNEEIPHRVRLMLKRRNKKDLPEIRKKLDVIIRDAVNTMKLLHDVMEHQ